MRILVSGNTMTYMSGQPLYCYTLAMELAKSHEISLVSNFTKGLSDSGKEIMRCNLESSGVVCVDFDDFKGGTFDLALLSEEISANLLDKIYCSTIVNIVHSEYDNETPIVSPAITKYVAIRPSIKDHLAKEHRIPEDKIAVIYNGIDRERFSPAKRVLRNDGLKRIVLPCSIDRLRKDFINFAVSKADRKTEIHIYGLYFGVRIGKFKRFLPRFLYDALPHDKYLGKNVFLHPPVFNIEDAIADADEVWGILLGRINLEANSMGIPSRIFDPVSLKDELFLMPEREFDERHNIVNVAKALIELA